MAKATWLNYVPITPPPNVLNLELTLREAEILRAVAGGILGSHFGPQGVMKGIYYALEDAGVIRADIYMSGDLKLEEK